MDGTVSSTQATTVIFLFLVSILAVLALMLWLGWRREGRRGSLCPYTNSKMKLGSDIARSIQMHVNAFLREERDPDDNPEIDFSKAAICEMTGRIFPDCVTSREMIALGWDFIQKRCPGTYVSWGALPENERAIFRILHGSIEGFQIEQSSSKIRPESIEREYAVISPGPLYADRKTKILLGWKKVPGTYFEVLVVQRPVFESIDQTI